MCAILRLFLCENCRRLTSFQLKWFFQWTIDSFTFCRIVENGLTSWFLCLHKFWFYCLVLEFELKSFCCLCDEHEAFRFNSIYLLSHKFRFLFFCVCETFAKYVRRQRFQIFESKRPKRSKSVFVAFVASSSMCIFLRCCNCNHLVSITIIATDTVSALKLIAHMIRHIQRETLTKMPEDDGNWRTEHTTMLLKMQWNCFHLNFNFMENVLWVTQRPTIFKQFSFDFFLFVSGQFCLMFEIDTIFVRIS